MSAAKNRLNIQASNLKIPSNALKNAQRDTEQAGEKLNKAAQQFLKEQQAKLQRHSEKLELLSFENVLQRGFVVIRDENGTPVATPDKLNENQNIIVQFKDDQKLEARITNKKASSQTETQQNPEIDRKQEKKQPQNGNQGSLF